jgi:glycosyltransferase involved in cell wall biosynthesis
LKNEVKPQLSVVVVVHNMARVAPRTLHSLSSAYQRNINPDEYEVIVVDNGSNPPFQPKAIASLPENFRLIRIDDASPSPARAANLGLAEARGEIIGLMIDGARLVTPGLLHLARHGAQLYDTAIVAALGWYLGHDYQSLSMQFGYDATREEVLLDSIHWPKDGYRLFEISVLDESSVDGWFQPISESNALFLRRKSWETLGGLEERFDEPGGGLLNLDIFRRAIELPGAELVTLLGEATFHQLHGGISTNCPVNRKDDNWARWATQYASIRGRPYEVARPKYPPTYLGTLPRPALLHFARAAVRPIPRQFIDPVSGAPLPLEPPLGLHFDTARWSLSPFAASNSDKLTEVISLMEEEFRSGRYAAAAGVARLIRRRAPDEVEPPRLLSLVAAYPPQPRDAEYQLALANAHRLLGDREAATSHYQAALIANRNLVQAHIGLATLRMPGDFYHVWLERFYTTLAPENVVEIGIDQGQSLSLVCPPTIAIGVDPRPQITFPTRAESHIFPETSDEFFAQNRLAALLAGRPLGVGFIDGLHLYEQALKDFIHLEAHCGPRSMILIHDTVPLDEATQSRNCDTQFHTGDIWKIVLCLKHYRRDLDVFTIATPLTGLTVVTGFNVESRAFSDSYEEAVSRFVNKPFSDIESNLESELNMVANDWAIVQARLKERGIL